MSELTLHLNAGCVRQHAQVLEEASLDLVEVLGRVLVGHVRLRDVQLEVRAVVLEVIVVGQLWRQQTSTGIHVRVCT